MYKYLTHNKLKFVIFCMLLIIFSVSSTLVAFVLGSVLDAAEGDSIGALIRVSIFAFACITTYIFVYFVYNKLKYAILKECNIRLRSDIFMAIMNKDVPDYEALSSAVYINEMTTNVGIMEERYFKNILDTLSTAVSFVTAIVATIMLQPLLLTIMLLIGVITLYITKLTSKGLETSSTEYSKGAEEYQVAIKEYFAGYRIIKVFCLFERIAGIHKIKNTHMEEKKRIQRNKILVCMCAGELVGFLATIMVMSVAAGFAIKDVISIGAVFAVGHLMGRITSPISSLPDIISNFKAAMPIRHKFTSFFEEITNVKKGIPFTGLKNMIRLEDVSFSYDDKPYDGKPCDGKSHDGKPYDDKLAINRINLEIRHGKKYAVVGESGSGKTTLMNLLLGYYGNYGGSIKYDGCEVRDFDISSLYAAVSSVSQDTFIFEESLRNNLTLFDTYDDGDIMVSIKKAELTEFLDNLPEGLDSQITENGKNLSGGERQRISLARVILRDSDILFFDEYTAALDPSNAYKIENYLLSMENKTILTITHRLNAEILKKYDGIIVLRNGSVEESGKYDELICKKGYFYELIQND